MAKSGTGGGAPKDGEKSKMQSATADDKAPRPGQPHIDPRIQHEIGKHLRAHYDDLVSEPVPDKFMELLAKLEQSVRQKG